MQEDNKLKSVHGQKNKLNLSSLLEHYYKKGYIQKNEKKYTEGYSNNPSQFKSDHLIEFNDGDQWVIHSTSTVRTDRAKQVQWDALHLKNLNNKISKVLLVYPDNLSPEEQQKSLSYQKQIREKKIYSAIDDCISTAELDQIIEEKALYTIDIGRRKALEGKNFEEKIVAIFNHDGNKEKWNTGSRTQDGYQFLFYSKVINLIGLKQDEKIEEINATDRISKLPSKGQPKTDVLLNINTNKNRKIQATFSCKRSSAKKVSIHQYKAESFIKALNITDLSLCQALFRFQECGGFKEMKNKYPSLFEIMEKNISLYNKNLSEWAYSGMHGEGDPKIHWAQYMIVYKNDLEEIEIYPMQEYIEKKLLNPDGQLGTPFQWTFPSKNKGKNIQLKGTI